MIKQKTASTIRKYHRLLGFFLAGIMAIYACSGVLLIFRTTDFLQYEQTSERQLPPGLQGSELGAELRLKGFKITREAPDQVIFEQGNYSKETGLVVLTMKDYAPPLQKLVKLHKATTNSPLYFMNMFFGGSLLFFAVSAFFMFLPRMPAYKTGLKFAGAGFLVALAMVLMA